MNDNPCPTFDKLFNEYSRLQTAETIAKDLFALRKKADVYANEPPNFTPMKATNSAEAFFLEVTRLKEVYEDLQRTLYCGESGPYDPPAYIRTEGDRRAWGKAFEFFGFDDSE